VRYFFALLLLFFSQRGFEGFLIYIVVFRLLWLAAAFRRPRIINDNMEEGGKDIGL